jgi:CubicO group peptidase (beta-lactamase class C family)
MRRSQRHRNCAAAAWTLFAGLFTTADTATADRVQAGAVTKEFLADHIELQLRHALEDLQRFGVLGAVMVIESPGLGRISVPSGHVDAGRTLPMDENRGFQIASQTKMFTAASILLLARDGLLSLDDPVSKHVQGIAGSDGVTLRHLLTHTSGLGDGVAVMDVPRPPPSVPVTFRDIVLLSALEGLRFLPGERFDYNNFGFDILGATIERVTGKPVSAYVRTRILGPLRMTGTYIGSTESWPGEAMARAYWTTHGKDKDVTGPRDLSYANTAGDMISTGPDMLKWFGALASVGDGTGLDLRDFTQGPVDTKDVEMPRYGFGMMYRKLGGREVLGHSGFIQGYMSYSGIAVDEGVRFSIMTSLDGNPDIDYRALKSQLRAAVEEALAMTSLAEATISRGNQE